MVDHGGDGRLSNTLGLVIAVQRSLGHLELLVLNHSLSLGFSRLGGGRAHGASDEHGVAWGDGSSLHESVVERAEPGLHGVEDNDDCKDELSLLVKCSTVVEIMAVRRAWPARGIFHRL